VPSFHRDWAVCAQPTASRSPLRPCLASPVSSLPPPPLHTHQPCHTTISRPTAHALRIGLEAWNACRLCETASASSLWNALRYALCHALDNALWNAPLLAVLLRKMIQVHQIWCQLCTKSFQNFSRSKHTIRTPNVVHNCFLPICFVGA
jgi:hypothetical protein